MSAALEQATHIEVEAAVRYWEDATVNGVEDSNGSRIPGRSGEVWHARIQLLDGIVEEWPAGTEADIHYKVCDQGEYWLADAAGCRIAKWRGYHVPNAFLCHGDEGFGDYIIMSIAGGGGIEGYVMPLIEPKQWELLDGVQHDGVPA